MTLPPGPTTPAALQALRWIGDPFRAMEQHRARYGDNFSIRLLVAPRGMVVVSEPDVVKEVFALGPEDAHAGKANAILRPFLGRHSLLVLDGTEHLRQRKMMMPAFHGERMHAYGRTMMELAHESIDGWPVGERFAVHRPMQKITMRVILRTVFGVAEGPRLAELGRHLTTMLDAVAWPGLLFGFMQRDLGRLSPWGRFVRSAKAASDLVRGEIRRGRDQGTRDGTLNGTSQRTDVLAMMLQTRDEAGRPMTEDEIHDELVTLLTAGHETTATALAWALRWILTDPALVARLRAEIAKSGGEPQAVAKLELLDATVKESLRLQPVIPMVGRVLRRPMKIGTLDLPEGVTVAPAIYLVHRRPSLYPDPARFLPDRFLTFKPSPSEWLPFGGGLRKCIGAAFAIYEMKMVLAAMLPRVDARLATDDIRVARRAITIAPSGGTPIVVTARRSRAAGVARAA